jgi:AraC-like DNA-binding protein
MLEANTSGDSFTEFYTSLEVLGIYKKLLAGCTKTESDYPPLMKEILLEINENIREIKNIDYLAAKFYLSQSTLFRLFRTHLNTTPSKYIEMRRLAYARKLLKNGSSVKEAASASGFSNVSNFIRLFKKRFGTTPRAYKTN